MTWLNDEMDVGKEMEKGECECTQIQMEGSMSMVIIQLALHER